MTLDRTSPKLSKIMIFIGAGIVLGTFVVKDVMNEKLKDANDSLGSAETFYLTQTYNIFIQDDLAYIKQEVDLSLSALQSKGKDQLEGSEQVLRTKAQAGNDHLNVVIEYVRNLASLIGKLPQETDKAGQARMLLVTCTQLSAEMKSLQSRLPELLSAITHNPKDPHAFAELTEFVKDTDPIPGKTQSIMDDREFPDDKAKAALVVAGRFKSTLRLGWCFLLQNDPMTALTNGGVKVPSESKADEFISNTCQRDYLHGCMSIMTALKANAVLNSFWNADADCKAMLKDVPPGRYYFIAIGQTSDMKFATYHRQVELTTGRNVLSFNAY